MSDKQLWPDAYIPREDAEAVVAEWKQRAEAVQKDADAMRCLAYECTQRKDAAEAALAAERARAEAAESKLAKVDEYAAYFNMVASKGDAPCSFADWLGGAHDVAERARDWATAPRIEWSDEGEV